MKHTFLAFASFLLSLGSFAQKGSTGFAAGVLAATNFTSVQENVEKATYKPGLGYSFGAFARVKLLKFYVQPEVSYGKQIAKLEVTNGKTVEKTDVVFNSIDIPVLFGFYLFRIKEASVRILAGPELSVFGTYKVGDTELNKKEAGIRAGYGALDFGLGADLGRFALDARYKYGLTSISSLQDNDINVRQVVVSLGFKIINRGE